MGIVLPESILNAKELASVRLFIYRFFQIVAIISLPRNLFIDTPTLTSLLFARKKTSSEVKSWDDAWGSAQEKAQTLIKSASKVLSKKEAKSRSALEVSKEYLSLIYPVANSRSWILKGGKSRTVHKFYQNWADKEGEFAANYYREIMKTAAFKELTQNFIFSDVAKKLNYEFPVFIVEEVGYKLSKRRERAKPNQLCTFKGRNTGSLRTNLHLSNEECDVVVQTAKPVTVLDHIRREVSWVGK
jgi:type I restriction enzyme M protein